MEMKTTKLQIQPGWKLAQSGIEGSGMGNEAGIVPKPKLATKSFHKLASHAQINNDMHLVITSQN